MYVARALTLFFGEGKSFVTIKAAEKLMDRALWVAEVVRRKVEGLHMIVKVTEKKIVDVWEPKEEGLLTVNEERFLTVIEVTLTRTPTAEEKKQPGYHVPLDIKNEYLTKESWEQGEKEREQRKTEGGEERPRREGGDRPPRRDREDRQDRPPRRDREERGGERRRGRGGDRD